MEKLPGHQMSIDSVEDCIVLKESETWDQVPVSSLSVIPGLDSLEVLDKDVLSKCAVSSVSCR